jgi:phospholipid/cholesterol/gamma-HCH transport system ATP-binding protein
MIEIENIWKSFGENNVLRGVSLEISDGETHAIIGKSGCGKSVLLKIIVALLKPDEGEIFIDGENIFAADEKRLYEIRKKFGFLFQSAALFDSLTVAENIALPLTESEEKKFSAAEISRLVSEKLEMVGLEKTENLKPSELSGGMQKRVGLARALITNPKYILYDEPTTGLDPIMSDSIDALIKSLNEQLNVTSIIVTHDMFSVENVAERISMIHEGEIYFTGSLSEILSTDDEVIKNFIKRTGFVSQKIL